MKVSKKEEWSGWKRKWLMVGREEVYIGNGRRCLLRVVTAREGVKMGREEKGVVNGSKRRSDQKGRQTYLVVSDVVVRKER